MEINRATWTGLLYGGHLQTSNFLFADGHVKAMRPLQTLDTASGGSSDVNLWTRDNSAFTSGSARANLQTATQ